MVDRLPQTSDCLHVGWALWRNHFMWWCGACGIDVSEAEYINALTAHQPGEFWKGNV